MPKYVILFSLVILLQACVIPAIQPAGGTVPAGPLATPTGQVIKPTQQVITTETTPTLTGTATATPIPPTSTTTPTQTEIPSTPTPTLTACMQAGGRVEISEFTTILLPDPLVYRVYLPPCYDEETERAYPVLYLIHGQTYSDKQWDDLGVPETVDRLVAAREMAPFIVVMPRDRVWREPTLDYFGKAVAQALVPWIDEHYRTIATREFRAIGGLSRGGAWAVDIGLAHPELFGAIGLHSGFVFYSDVYLVPEWLNELPQGMVPRIYMDIADEDRPEIEESASWFEGLLTERGIPHEWHIFIGEHEDAYWGAHVEDYLHWYSQEWEK